MTQHRKVTLSHNLCVCRLDNWIRLLHENKISKGNRLETFFLVTISVICFIPACLEALIFAIPINRKKMEKDPIFIIGHWRSGTTMLQNLISRDPQFGWFDPVTTMGFNHCIMFSGLAKWLMNHFHLLDTARPMDNLDYTLDLPMEETFAQATFSNITITHMLIFPGGPSGDMAKTYLDRAFVDERPEKEQKAFERSYRYTLKKANYVKKGKQLLLKSPENTCKVGLLKKMYPNAKFINIYRDPYATIVSTINMFKKMIDKLALNESVSDEMIEDYAVILFERVYRKLFDELYQMDEKDYIEIRYEDLCTDQLGYTKDIYDYFGIEGFEEAKPYFEAYLETQKDYKKNNFRIKPQLRDKINQKMGFYFEHYGYEMITE